MMLRASGRSGQPLVDHSKIKSELDSIRVRMWCGDTDGEELSWEAVNNVSELLKWRP
jgi:hypothetical protein